ncbi:MAG: STAS domain-containing protein, partial [Candidatus Limnocylindria bacterium]
LWRENRVHAGAAMDGSTLHLRPRGVLYFGSAHRLEQAFIRQLSLHREAEHLVVHLDGLGRIDVTGAIALGRLLDDAIDAGLSVEICDVPIQARRIVDRVLGRHLAASPTPND